MIPGIMGAPLLNLKKDRRKLTHKTVYKRQDRFTPGDVNFLIEIRAQLKAPASNAETPLFTSQNTYCNAAVVNREGSSRTSGEYQNWRILESYWRDMMSVGFRVPEEFLTDYDDRLPEFRASHFVWRDFENHAGSGDNISITMPTSSATNKPFIAVAVYGTGNTQGYGLTPTWQAPEGPDQQAWVTGDYGKVNIIRASLYADGKPPYNITVGCRTREFTTLHAAIIQIPGT